MATPLSLAERAREQQAKLATSLGDYLEQAYREQIGPRDARKLVERWIETVAPQVVAIHAESAYLARATYELSRALDLPNDSWTFGEMPELNEDALRTSLFATGFGDLVDALNRQQKPVSEAIDYATSRTVGAGVRHALNGGRQYVVNAIAADPKALAYYRVTKPGCCYFCAALASRGAVYKANSFDDSDPRFIGPGEVKVHDHCACGYQGIWTPGAPVQSHAAEFRNLWDSSTKGRSGNAAMLAFRRAYEAAYPQSG